MKKGSIIKLILIVLVVELAVMAVLVWPDISNRIYQTTDSPALITEGAISSTPSTATTKILNPTRTPYFFYFKKVASKTPSPTATFTATNTNTYTPTRQFILNRTPIYTQTRVPQNNPTNTPVPTQVPPTNTPVPTQVPPTNTPVPTQVPPTPAPSPPPPTVVPG